MHQGWGEMMENALENTIDLPNSRRIRDEIKAFFNRTPIRALVNAIIDIVLAVYTACVKDWKSP